VNAPDSEYNDNGTTRYPNGYGTTWDEYEIDCDNEEIAIERAIDRFKKDNKEDNRELIEDSIVTDVTEIRDD